MGRKLGQGCRYDVYYLADDFVSDGIDFPGRDFDGPRTAGQDMALKNFSWQRGYGAFTVSQSNVEAVPQYIARQKEHHQKISFRDEFIQFLRENGIEYDERFI